MQREHFWYRGRHKLLQDVFSGISSVIPKSSGKIRAIDLGGGCGGWLAYLHRDSAQTFDELALGDSSLQALKLSAPVVGSFAKRYQIDLLDLKWKNRWDVVFLLDVLEHIEDDAKVIEQIKESLRPGGILILTTPALRFFWSFNDRLAHHKRRYSIPDLARLAAASGMKTVSCRYFMFFLSPLLYLSRLRHVNPDTMTPEQIRDYFEKSHRVPSAPINRILSTIFLWETKLQRHITFPWGTSVLAVFQKPA